ncbi:MAG: hypothetical protein QY331_04330 [Melioribacteraceae bacterium]|nr:MAG: hypothetical protein QY331_04330 [Melioribacteraceae bacterium]
MHEIITLEVGHGDSLILKYEIDSTIKYAIIDCHKPTNTDKSPTLKYLQDHKISEISFICLTHPDKDHYSGLLELLNYSNSNAIKINRYYDFGMDVDKYRVSTCSTKQKEKELYELYKKLLDYKNKFNIEYNQLSYNTILEEHDEFRIFAIAPFNMALKRYRNQASKALNTGRYSLVDKNLLSAVLLIKDGKSISLLCSDANSESLKSALAKYEGDYKKEISQRKISMVKVSHHGSKTGYFKELYDNYCNSGTKAVISANGTYNLPAKDIVEKIAKENINIYCTGKPSWLANDGRKLDLDLRNELDDELIIEGLEQDTIKPFEIDGNSFNGTISFSSNSNLIQCTGHPHPLNHILE